VVCSCRAVTKERARGTQSRERYRRPSQDRFCFWRPVAEGSCSRGSARVVVKLRHPGGPARLRQFSQAGISTVLVSSFSYSVKIESQAGRSAPRPERGLLWGREAATQGSARSPVAGQSQRGARQSKSAGLQKRFGSLGLAASRSCGGVFYVF